LLTVWAMILSRVEALGYLVAPPITSNISFNEKIRFLGKQPSFKKYRLCVLGSSQAFYSIDVESFREVLGADDLVNVSAWSMRPSQWVELYDLISARWKFGIVILPINVVDFQKPIFEIDRSWASYELGGWPDLFPHFRFFDLEYYHENAGPVRTMRANTDPQS